MLIPGKERTRKVGGFEGFVDTEDIRATYYCLDCEHIFENMIILPPIFNNLSLGLFLHLLVLHRPAHLGDELPELTQDPTRTYSLLASFFPKRSDPLGGQCFHLRMTRTYVQGHFAVTLEKQPLRIFRLLSNREIKPKKVENQGDLASLVNIRAISTFW